MMLTFLLFLLTKSTASVASSPSFPEKSQKHKKLRRNQRPSSLSGHDSLQNISTHRPEETGTENKPHQTSPGLYPWTKFLILVLQDSLLCSQQLEHPLQCRFSCWRQHTFSHDLFLEKSFLCIILCISLCITLCITLCTCGQHLDCHSRHSFTSSASPHPVSVIIFYERITVSGPRTARKTSIRRPEGNSLCTLGEYFFLNLFLWIAVIIVRFVSKSSKC